MKEYNGYIKLHDINQRTEMVQQKNRNNEQQKEVRMNKTDIINYNQINRITQDSVTVGLNFIL